MAARPRTPEDGAPPADAPGPVALACVGAVALALRLAHLWLAGERGLFHDLYLDSAHYAARARELRLGLAPDGPSLLSPLYPWLLLPFTGDDGALHAVAARAFQAVVGALTACACAALAGRVAGRRAAWLAGLGLALYGPAVHYDAALLTAGPQAALVTLGALLLVRARRFRGHVAAGLALALSAALRPTGLVLMAGVGAAAVAAALVARDERAARLRLAGERCVALALAAALVVLPFTLRNLAHGGEPVLLSANGGFNLWVGNHAGAQGRFAAPPGYDFDADPVGRALASREAGRELGWRAASAWWRDRAVAWATEHPGDFAALLGRKALLFAHPQEIPQLGESFPWFRARLPTLRFPLDGRHVLLLALLAPAAALLRRGRAGLARLRWPLLLLALHAGAVSLFFVTGRFRAPILPVALALAASCAVDLAALALGPRRRAALALAALLAGGVAGSHALYLAPGAPLAVPDSEGAEETQLGISLFAQGRTAEAIEAFRAALALRDDPLTRVDLAAALAAAGQHGAARDEYRRALAADPHNALGWYNYANLLRVRSGDLAAAEDAYRRALELRPGLAEAHLNLAALLLERERPAEAAASLRRALELGERDAPWRPSAERVLAEAEARASEG